MSEKRIKGNVFPMGSSKSARSSLTAEQLLYAVVKTLGGRIAVREEVLFEACDGDHRVFDQVLEKEHQHYLVLAIESRLL